MISSIALLHQFQRERHTTALGELIVTYIEATDEDIAHGLALADALTVRSEDSLSPQASRLLETIRRETCRVNSDRSIPDKAEFTRRELREQLGWTVTQVRAACDSLVALEYLEVSGGGRGRSRTYRSLDDKSLNKSADGSTSTSPAEIEMVKLVKLVDFTDETDDVVAHRDSYAKIGNEAPS
jgi:DNA-binding MarR family transcriptional regulator